MIPLASYAAQKLGKRMGKVSTQGMENAGFLSTHLLEIFNDSYNILSVFNKFYDFCYQILSDFVPRADLLKPPVTKISPG